MSISLILVPLAVAAAAKAASAGGSAQPNTCTVATRLRDPRLLTLALGDTGATAMQSGPDAIDAAWADLVAQLRRGADGIWQAHFTGTGDEQRCVDTVLAIDQAYGQRVQAEVLHKLRDRAPQAGMDLVSETQNSDRSVTMVLEVRR
ncbi:hypothetical protein AB0H76_34745 [Nocardia sp. NPDC050712]|uniref:hypothetical protein n=1 Tax=Nocardia sp. NPDC050712 TaxID=3155518 RepID=UPI0033FBC42C